MDNSYYFRELVESDWEAFHKLDEQAFGEADSIKKEGFLASLGKPKSLLSTIVDKETKELIGYYIITAYGHEGHIQRIAVRPDYQRKGLGTALMNKCEAKLQEAGCKKFFLYVQRSNESAINLYKKQGFIVETKSNQYLIPFDRMVKKPKGILKEVQWNEIQMVCLRFGQNPFRIQSYYGSNRDFVFTYEQMGEQIGFCRFTPSFPGAMPFVINNIDYALDFVALLKEHTTNKDLGLIKITFDAQEDLVNKLDKEGFKKNYELYRMSK